MSSGRLDQVWAVLLHYEKMKRGEAKAISSMLNIHYFSIDPSLQTEIVPMIQLYTHYDFDYEDKYEQGTQDISNPTMPEEQHRN